jgi:hypothetical protein
MALYLICQYLIHNIGFSHDCYAILIVYHTMPCPSISYAIYVVRPDELSKDTSLLCLQAYLSVLHVHPMGGRPRDARVVTSYTDVVLRYAGSLRYHYAPWCLGVGGRW